MLGALAAGEQDPQVLAQMAKGRLRDKLSALQEALSGVMGSHQRFLLGVQLRHLEALEEEIEKLDAEVARPCRGACRSRAGRGHDSRYWSPDGGGDRGGDGDGHGALCHPGSTWRRGRVCVRATTKVLTRAVAVRPARATRRCVRPWWKQRAARPVPRRTWGRSYRRLCTPHRGQPGGDGGSSQHGGHAAHYHQDQASPLQTCPITSRRVTSRSPSAVATTPA